MQCRSCSCVSAWLTFWKWMHTALSVHGDRQIYGTTCSALFPLTEETRLILSSSVRIALRANLSIYTLIHSRGCVCVCVCVSANVLYCRVQACCMLHMCCICIASCHSGGLRGSDLMHMCGIIRSVCVCACARVVTLQCYYFHVCLWWVVAHRAYGWLYVHVSGVKWAYVSACVSPCAQVYARGRVRVCVCLCACVPFRSVCVCAFAIYFSEWVAKYSYASRVRVCERVQFCGCVSFSSRCACASVCWLGLHVCVGARWSVSWLALAGELEESRGETGDLQKRHAPLPPLLLFLFLPPLRLRFSLPVPSSRARFFLFSPHLCPPYLCTPKLCLPPSALGPNQIVLICSCALYRKKRLARLNLRGGGPLWVLHVFTACH